MERRLPPRAARAADRRAVRLLRRLRRGSPTSPTPTANGFVYRGQYSRFRGRRHGASPAGLPADRFVVFVQNHDQVGNRARGRPADRRCAADAAARLAAAPCCSPPFVPLLFMGEEYGETRAVPVLRRATPTPSWSRRCARAGRASSRRSAGTGDCPTRRPRRRFAVRRCDLAGAADDGRGDAGALPRAAAPAARAAARCGARPRRRWRSWRRADRSVLPRRGPTARRAGLPRTSLPDGHDARACPAPAALGGAARLRGTRPAASAAVGGRSSVLSRSHSSLLERGGTLVSGHQLRSGQERRTRSARPGTAKASTSRSSPSTRPRVELCLFDNADDGEASATIDARRAHRPDLALLPARRPPGPALRLPRARALRARRGPPLQPGQAR